VDNTMLVINYDARDVSSEVNMRNINRIEWRKKLDCFQNHIRIFFAPD
jgi:hypothetical protein